MKCSVCGIELSPKVYELHVKDCKIEEEITETVIEEAVKEEAVVEEKAKSGKK